MITIDPMLFECYNYHMTTCVISDILDNCDATACQGLSPAILPPEMGSVLTYDWSEIQFQNLIPGISKIFSRTE